MTEIVWPYDGLPPRTVTPEPVYATVGGGRSLTAIEQVISSDAGFWSISYDGVPVVSGDQKKLWRAVSALAEGRLNPIIAWTYDTDTNPWPLVGGVPFTSYGQGIPHSDDSLFSDGTGYDQPIIQVSISGAVVRGAVTIVLDVLDAGELEPGQHFSVNNRLFRIKRIVSVVGTLNTVLVWPPAREAIADGAVADFDRPACRCRLATDAEMMSGKDDYAGRTVAAVNFVEFLP